MSDDVHDRAATVRDHLADGEGGGDVPDGDRSGDPGADGADDTPSTPDADSDADTPGDELPLG